MENKEIHIGVKEILAGGLALGLKGAQIASGYAGYKMVDTSFGLLEKTLPEGKSKAVMHFGRKAFSVVFGYATYRLFGEMTVNALESLNNKLENAVAIFKAGTEKLTQAAEEIAEEEE